MDAMKKIIKQIGFEGRTTIPQIIRDAMGLPEKAFISFTYDAETKSVVIKQEWICDDCAAESTEVNPELIELVLSMDEDMQKRAIFVLEYMLFLKESRGRNAA